MKKLSFPGITFRMESGERELNPILYKELRTQFRKKLFFVIQTIYAAILGIIFLVLYYNSDAQFGQHNDVGTLFFLVIMIAQAWLIFFIAASLSSSVFAKEKEQGTFESLLLTEMNTKDLFAGKLFSSILPVFLFTISSFPIIAMSIFWGGVSPWIIILSFLGILLLILTSGIIGLAYSIIFDTVRKAKTATYLTLFLFPIFWFLLPILGILLWALSYNKLKNYNGLRRRKFRKPIRKRRFIPPNNDSCNADS